MRCEAVLQPVIVIVSRLEVEEKEWTMSPAGPRKPMRSTEEENTS